MEIHGLIAPPWVLPGLLGPAPLEELELEEELELLLELLDDDEEELELLDEEDDEELDEELDEPPVYSSAPMS